MLEIWNHRPLQYVETDHIHPVKVKEWSRVDNRNTRYMVKKSQWPLQHLKKHELSCSNYSMIQDLYVFNKRFLTKSGPWRQCQTVPISELEECQKHQKSSTSGNDFFQNYLTLKINVQKDTFSCKKEEGRASNSQMLKSPKLASKQTV